MGRNVHYFRFGQFEFKELVEHPSVYIQSRVNRDVEFMRDIWAGSAGYRLLFESLEWIISLKEIVCIENRRVKTENTGKTSL